MSYETREHETGFRRQAKLIVTSNTDRFDRWVEALETRHLRDLEFREVSKALRALSSTYVERRDRVPSGGALTGTGKRAAFALFYAPLHFLLVHQIVRSLSAAPRPLIVDLGCGTGAAGAAWALAGPSKPRLVGVDRHPWAIQEAAWTYRQLGLQAKTMVADLVSARVPHGPASLVAAFALNELPDEDRDVLLKRFLDRVNRGDSLLIVEPIAKRVTPWWDAAHALVERAGGRADEWRFAVTLPAIVQKLDDATGLHHGEITGRSLFVS